MTRILKYHFASTLAFLFSFTLVQGQYFSTGQDPASIRWRQIDTEYFQLIFPADFEEKAQYVANVFEDLRLKGSYSLRHNPQKFSVIFRTRGAISNGLVGWAPKRMELFATPPQTHYPQNWLKQLAIHEYRHIVQIDKINQGFTRFLSFLFGEQATIAVTGLYIPPWFIEGDAVCTETVLSESGRGRLPFFEQELKAQLLEKGIYSYDKAVLGSFKNYVPNRYKLGYHMVALGRRNYGTDIWEKTLTRVGKNSFELSPFSLGIKNSMVKNRSNVLQNMRNRLQEFKNITHPESAFLFPANVDSLFRANTRGDAKITLYLDNMNELMWEWRIQDSQNKISEYNQITPENKVYTNYRFPHYGKNNDILALKKGLADAAHFVRLSRTGKEEEIFVPGIDFGTAFDYHDNILLWAELKEHVRWQHGERAAVITYNLETKKRKCYQFDHNLFAPAFSPDGRKIVAIEVSPAGNNSLVILDVETGRLIKRVPAQKDDFFMTPQWGRDSAEIIAVLLNRKGKQLVQITIEDGQIVNLLPPGFRDISQPRVGANYLFFTGAYSGIDNIYALDLNARKIYQITTSRFGARDAHISPDGETLLYVDYSSNGYSIVEIPVKTQQWKEWNGKVAPFRLAEAITQQEQGKLKDDSLYRKQFVSSRYSKVKNLFNFHSWAPVFIDGLEQETDIGVSAATQNMLSTLFATFGYRKVEGFNNGQYYMNFSYRGWFPVIDSRFTYGDSDVTFFTVAERVDNGQIDTLRVNRSWTQWEWENSIRLPLTISKGKYSRQIIPEVTYNQLRLVNFTTLPLERFSHIPGATLGNYRFDDSDRSQQIMEYKLFAFSLLKSAPRDIQPRWGQVWELQYRNSPFGDVDLGNTWSGEMILYFPGFTKHHGIKLYGGYQQRSPFNSRFANTILSPRGTGELFGKEIATLKTDYRFPLLYPDWNIGPFTYFKRVKTGLFFDYGFRKGATVEINEEILPFQENNYSFGIELTTDMHIFRLPAPVNLGFRIGYENETRSSFADFLFSISLSSY